MTPRRETFAPTLEAQARRMSASTSALNRYALAGIESGAVQKVLAAALAMTASAEAVSSWWHSHRGQPLPQQMLARLEGPARNVLDAMNDLKERG